MRREQRRYVRLGEQRVDRGEPAAGIGHGDLAGALVVSRPAGLGTGATSTPWASAAAPLRFVAPRTRTRYLPPGASGRAVCTTSRSDGTGRCFSSLRIRVVSSGSRGSSGSENTTRNAVESTGSTLFTRGPTLSCTNSHSTALAVESTVTVTVSNASRRSSRRLLF